jgi:MGT family glycosyltransferase
MSPLFPVRDGLNIVFTARELQPDTPIIDGTFRFVGPSIDPQTRSEGEDFDLWGQDRVVYISFGTLHAPQPSFIAACFEAFAGHPARFILSGVEPQGLAVPAPANFIVRPSVRQLEVLQRADVFITHGGLNSVHEGLYFGVPLVIVPHQFEQLLNARAVSGRGAGLIIEERLAGRDITATRLRQSLTLVSSESRYRESAGALQRALRATGGYRQAADEIQGYIGSRTRRETGSLRR